VTANPYKPRSTILRAPGVEPMGAPPPAPSPLQASSGPARSLAPGSVVLGRYTIQKVIGRGGMATVYLARNQETERLVALKILDPEISSDPSYVERFRREARAAGRIRSDHVVAIYDLGTDESGTLVLVMEYLEGQTVQQALRNGRLPIPRIGHLGRHLCEGLAAAHECGVIHRDLKPANLFIERMPAGAEKLKVLDCGISKLAEASSQELTRAGQTLGTLAYMAPEQIRGTVKGNDPRIDLYAAGVSLFLMLTAKRPIDADDTVQLLQAVLEKPPLTLQQACGVEFPPALESFVAKALQKDSARRFQNAIEMRDTLLAAVSAPASVSSPPIEEVMEVNSTIMCEAPRFDSLPPTATPSGVIARNGLDAAPSPVMLPSFDDDEEEGKTVVRVPQSAPGEAPAVLPAAGRRIGVLPELSPQPAGTPMRAATIAPTGLPNPSGPQSFQPASSESTMIADPAGANPFGAFGPPGMQAPAMGPPPTTSNPFGPLGASSPFAPPAYTAPAPAVAPAPAAPRRSPLVFVLGAAAMVALVLVGLAGKVALDARNPPPVSARIEPPRAPAPLAAPAPMPEAASPVAQPIAAPEPTAAPVAVAEPPAPAPTPEPAAAPAPVPVPPAAEPAPEPAPAAVAAHAPAARPHRDRAPASARVAAPSAPRPVHVAAPSAPTRPAARPPRAGRRGGRGVITAVPF
jgi:eukaryotic-like serine/threonine-protein kinase